MRHTRTRRRFKTILSVLLALCFTLFMEARIEAFVPQLNTLAEARIGELLGSRVKLSVGSVDGGILHPLSVNDIRIKDKNDADPFPFIEINRITTTYRIWDIISEAVSGRGLSGITGGSARADVAFATRRADVSGFARVDGGKDFLKCTGFVRFNSTGDKVDFCGRIDDGVFYVELRSGKGDVFIRGRFTDTDGLLMKARVVHLRAAALDITCDLELKNAIVPDTGPSGRRAAGEVSVSALALNGKPFHDITASYSVDNGVVTVSKCRIGDAIMVRGSVSLKDPHPFDATALVDNVSVMWLLSTFGVRDAGDILTGTLSGKFAFNGTRANTRSDIRFGIRKGTIGKLDFDNLSAALKGEGPVLRIEDSRIDRRSGYFTLAGDIDMRKAGRESMFKTIKVSSDENAITWDEWEVKESKGLQEVRMNKRLSDEFSLDFNKFMDDKNIDESGRHMDKVGLGYRLNDTEKLKVVVGEDSGFFGVEHKDKF